MPPPLRVMEVVQSLEKGGRTTRFYDTILGLKEQDIFVFPLCFSKPTKCIKSIELHTIEKKHGINWRIIFQIIKIIKDNKINLIHAHCEFSQLYVSIAGFTCGVETVATFHRSDLSKYEPNIVNKLIKLFVSQFVAVSHDRLSLLTSNLKLPKTKCHVVHGGSAIEKKPTSDSINATRIELNIPINQLVLMSIGHLGHIKGHQDTLVALSHIQQTNKNIHLYIAGEGTTEEIKRLYELVKKLKIGEKVTFLGQIDNVPKWLEACDIFVQPSIEEAFGLVFAEAGAKAKPVIATIVGGIKEIVISEKTGLLVPPASPKALQAALEILIRSPTLRTLYGNNGYKRIAENFSLADMVHKYIDIFTQAK
ncbi:MAG: glycosyltransferase family 4 protein [Cognaticolwellia sp.]